MIPTLFRYGGIGFGAFLVLDIIYLNVQFIQLLQNQTQTLKANSVSVQSPIKQISITSSSCPLACLSTIEQATAESKTVQPTVSVSKTSNVAGSSVKEYFVPFGSGSNSSSDWQDVAGLQAAVDSNSYGQIKSVFFEASVHIPTGNETAYVRLFNTTVKHPVWYSDVSISGGTPLLLTSQPITLDRGNNVYQVQMKTDLQYPAILDQARLHITVY